MTIVSVKSVSVTITMLFSPLRSCLVSTSSTFPRMAISPISPTTWSIGIASSSKSLPYITSGLPERLNVYSLRCVPDFLPAGCFAYVFFSCFPPLSFVSFCVCGGWLAAGCCSLSVFSLPVSRIPGVKVRSCWSLFFFFTGSNTGSMTTSSPQRSLIILYKISTSSSERFCATRESSICSFRWVTESNSIFERRNRL